MNMKDFSIGVATGIAAVGVSIGAAKMYNWIVSGEAAEDIKEAGGTVVYKSFAASANNLTMESLYEADGRFNKTLRETLAISLAYYAMTEDLDVRDTRKHLDFIDLVDDTAMRAVIAKEAKRILGLAFVAKQEDPKLDLDRKYFEGLFD